VLAFILDLLRDYGLDDFYLELSTRGESDKFIGSDEEWESATETLRHVAEESGLELVPDPGGAAFYGPKISVQARDAIGRTWQMSTVQLDFNQPKRFGLEYTAADGTRQEPIMIHRALFGSIERFMGVLIEHYAGAMPPWLSPVQVVGIPIGDAHVPFHAALNYDGQLTQQWGIHARFESELFERYRSQLVVRPGAAVPVASARELSFASLTESYTFVQPILEADRLAVAGRDVYDDGYYRQLFAKARPILEGRLADSVRDVVSVITAAWVEAGQPAVPVTVQRAPRTVRRQ